MNFDFRMDSVILQQLTQGSATDLMPKHTLKAVKIFFEDNHQCNVSTLMTFIRQYYRIPKQCSLGMKNLVRYLSQISFLEHRSYTCTNGKRVDIFVRRSNMMVLTDIYRTALMFAEASPHAHADSIMLRAIGHIYKEHVFFLDS